MENIIVVHYGEIGIKGKNRPLFERQLISNIKNKLSKYSVFVKKDFGRFVITGDVISGIEKELSQVFGIAHFSYAIKVTAGLQNINAAVIKLLGDMPFTTFGIATNRATKTFPLKSPEVNAKVGAFVLDTFVDKKVNLSVPDVWVYVDIVDKYAYVYTRKIPGLGGLPVGVSGRGLVMLSGGIDSPVAAFYMMKRGMFCDFIHFHTYPCTERESIDKVEDLVKILRNYQKDATLHLVPFGKLQKEIVRLTKPKYRVLLYRRFMMRVAWEVAKNNDIKALITGESLGQVASQTIENINITQSVVDIPVLRPLIGMDKLEIMNKACEIGTYDTSILPHEDCCTRFIPKHPVTKGKLSDISHQENSLDIDLLVADCLSNVEIVEL